MKYILVFWIAYYPPMTVVEFDSQKSCMAAGAAISEKRQGRVEYICVKKGE